MKLAEKRSPVPFQLSKESLIRLNYSYMRRNHSKRYWSWLSTTPWTLVALGNFHLFFHSSRSAIRLHKLVNYMARWPLHLLRYAPRVLNSQSIPSSICDSKNASCLFLIWSGWDKGEDLWTTRFSESIYSLCLTQVRIKEIQNCMW